MFSSRLCDIIHMHKKDQNSFLGSACTRTGNVESAKDYRRDYNLYSWQCKRSIDNSKIPDTNDTLSVFLGSCEALSGAILSLCTPAISRGPSSHKHNQLIPVYYQHPPSPLPPLLRQSYRRRDYSHLASCLRTAFAACFCSDESRREGTRVRAIPRAASNIRRDWDPLKETSNYEMAKRCN